MICAVRVAHDQIDMTSSTIHGSADTFYYEIWNKIALETEFILSWYSPLKDTTVDLRIHRRYERYMLSYYDNFDTCVLSCCIVTLICFCG